MAEGPSNSLWAFSQIARLPVLTGYLYNILLDSTLDWERKAEPFGVLCYVFEASGVGSRKHLIETADPALGRLDDLALTLGVCQRLFEIVHPATTGRYLEPLHGLNVDVAMLVREAPARLGLFYSHMEAIRIELVQVHRPYLGNAIRTGLLVTELQRFMRSFTPPHPDPKLLAVVDAFLAKYK